MQFLYLELTDSELCSCVERETPPKWGWCLGLEGLSFGSLDSLVLFDFPLLDVLVTDGSDAVDDVASG